ncbi:MAG: hypothetical protein ABIK78_07125 [candidate division WOR-3 bacterium]
MKITKNILIILAIIALIGVVFAFSFVKKEKAGKVELTEEKNREEQETKEKEVCIEGMSWGFRGVEYKITGWENHEIAGKVRKVCCGTSKEYDGTFYKACAYKGEYILWVKAPYTNNEFRKDTVGYRKNGQFCKVSYDYYQPGEKIESENCYSESE